MRAILIQITIPLHPSSTFVTTDGPALTCYHQKVTVLYTPGVKQVHNVVYLPFYEYTVIHPTFLFALPVYLFFPPSKHDQPLNFFIVSHLCFFGVAIIGIIKHRDPLYWLYSFHNMDLKSLHILSWTVHFFLAVTKIPIYQFIYLTTE